MSVRLLLVENRSLVRLAVKTLLLDHADIQLVGETDSFSAVLTYAKKTYPDVILLSLELEDGEIVKRIPELRLNFPHSKILAHSKPLDPEPTFKLLQQGVAGIYSQLEDYQLLPKAIRCVYAGEIWVSRAIAALMWQNLSSRSAALPLHELTTRERQIACLVTQGYNAKEIGKRLSIGEKTVRNQLSSVYSKLETRNRVDLVIKAAGSMFCKSCDQPDCRNFLPDTSLK